MEHRVAEAAKAEHEEEKGAVASSGISSKRSASKSGRRAVFVGGCSQVPRNSTESDRELFPEEAHEARGQGRGGRAWSRHCDVSVSARGRAGVVA